MRSRKALMAAVVLAIGGTTSSDLLSQLPAPAATQPAATTQPALPPTAPAVPALPAIPTLPAPATTTTAPPPASLPARATQSEAQVAPSPATAPATATTPSTAPATANPTTAPAPSEGAPPAPEQLGKRIVSANLARDVIAPELGASSYTVGPSEIAAIPGGESAAFQKTLLRMPGVVEDSFGQEHIRGEHANLTYRVNGVLLPQPIEVFGQELDTRLVSSVTLIDGALPAQFGFHTAGIVDVTTKSGATLNHNELTIYGGMYDTIQPSLQLGGTAGKLDYFVTTSYNHNGLGIENTTGSHAAFHDYTDQERIFAYLSYHIDDTSRLSIFTNAYYGDFEVPDTKGVAPAFTFAGHPNTNSLNVNENQNEQEYYTVVSYQKSVDKLAYQLSGFVRYGQITFHPDAVNDLIFQGVSGAVYNNFVTYGTQLDASYVLNDQHTIRSGVIVNYTGEKNDTNTGVFPVDAAGMQTTNVPTIINNNSGNVATESGIYVQDEWKVLPQVTLNYGARYDRFDSSFNRADQLSPRVNVVWKIDDATTAHAGYARYFVPPPIQNLRGGSVFIFNNTTNAPGSAGIDPARVERSNYYDLGLSHQFTKSFQVSVDGFYKQARQLVDLGQFGSAIIFSPFNYRSGTVYGAEMAAQYKEGGFSGFCNFSWVRTMAHDIDTQEFNIAGDELAYIKTHNIFLDHDSTYTISAGASYSWKNDRVYVDMLYGSGLRAGFANTMQEPQHYPVNIGYEHIFRGGFWGPNNVKMRVDVVNVFDQSYQLREGGGLGVNADQYGQRRSIYGGMTYEF